MKGNTFLVSKKFSTVKLTRAAILISMSLVLNLVLQVYIPVGGVNGIKFTLSSAITMLTGIVCGPLIGFFAGAIVDILTCLIKPVGPYFPAISFAAGLIGLIPGLIFKYFNKDNKINYNIINTIFIFLLSLATVYAFILKGLLTFENSRLYYENEPLNIFFIIGFFVLVICYILVPIIITKKIKSKMKVDKVLFSVSITQLISSIILNTYFISILYGKGILILLPGRIMSNFFMIPLYTLIVCTLLETLNKLHLLDKQ